jgi:adenosylcobinamide amidohydrolase
MTARRCALLVLAALLPACSMPAGSGLPSPEETPRRAALLAGPENPVTPDRAPGRKPLPSPFPYVAETSVNEASLSGFPAKTLLLRFTGPQTVLSGLSGWKEGVRAVGNHYISPPGWPMLEELGMERTNAAVLALFGLEPDSSVLMFTGADMDNLAYAEAGAEGLKVAVLATAGVLGNAMRASADSGAYVEPGTVNLIILTNRELTPAAMTGAVIQATEAKTAAMQDLDIRSSYSGLAATGTGTDNILVVSGTGPPAEMIGGHTKLGELLGRAVHQAVLEAVWKQNRLFPARDVFRRLDEHRVNPAALIERSSGPESPEQKAALTGALERLLLEPRYADFLLAALAVSDSLARGLTADTGAFAAWCRLMANEVAGGTVENRDPLITDESVPPFVREALNGLLSGLRSRLAPDRCKGVYLSGGG